MRHLINLDWADREQEHHLRDLIRPLSTEQARKVHRAAQARPPETGEPAAGTPAGAVRTALHAGDQVERGGEADVQLELGGLGVSSRRAKSVLGTIRTGQASSNDVAEPVPAPQPDLHADEHDGTVWALAAAHRAWRPEVPAAVAPIDAAEPNGCEGDQVASILESMETTNRDECVARDEVRPALTWVCVSVAPGPCAPSYARVLGYAGPAADDLVRTELRGFGGTLLRDRPGSFIVEFAQPVAALQFAASVQRALHGGGDQRHTVRVGVHSADADGEPSAPSSALAEALAVRISAAAGDDQILVSASAVVGVSSSDGLELRELPQSVIGEGGACFRLSDLAWR